MLPAVALALQILLLGSADAEQQTTDQTTAPSQTPPQLPVDLNKVRMAVTMTPKLNLEEKFRFYSETVRPAPKFSDMVGSFDLFNGPTPHAGMTHKEFVQSTRPKDMFSSAGFTPGDLIRGGLLSYAEMKGWELIKKGLKELNEAKTEAERKQIRLQIERELAALRGDRIK